MRQRLRATLLRQLRDIWDFDRPVNDVELQLAGLKFCDESGASSPLIDKMPLIQKRLAETVMTLPGTTIVEEFCPRNAAIDAVAAYCYFQEGGACCRPTRATFVAKGESDLVDEDGPAAGSGQGREAGIK
jgi:hypothetical protein